MIVYGLVDCNNFFVSCERVFQPALEGRPAVGHCRNEDAREDRRPAREDVGGLAGSLPGSSTATVL